MRKFTSLRTWAFSVVISWLITGGIMMPAAEVHLELPDPLIAGVVQRATIIVENSATRVDHIDLPPVADLQWEAQRGSNYQVSIFNGKQSTKETIPILLRTQQTTALTIPAIIVTFADGSTVSTAAVAVQPQAPDTSLSGEAVATVTFEPATIVPGQPSTLFYRLSLRQDRPRAIKEPSLTPPAGLLVLGERSETNGETTDKEGNKWQIQTWRWPVSAAQPGSFEARGQQEWFRCSHDLFNRLVAESSHQLPIKPGVLTVTNLPEEGRPADFTGLIGPLETSAAIERSRIAAGEGTIFTLTLKGPQVGLAKRPTLTLPPGVQAYPKDDDDGKAGERHFRWDLVPASAGELVLPAIAFPYFDPVSKSYQRATSSTITVTVLPGRSRELVISGEVTPKKIIAAPTASLPSENLRTMPPPIHGETYSSAPARWTWPVLFVALAFGGIIGLGQRLSTRPKRGPHRGRALAAAIAAKDLDAMARWVFALRPDLDDAGRQAADALEQAIDRARFGSTDAGDLKNLAATLIKIP
jgi:BatD DUF11 like domain